MAFSDTRHDARAAAACRLVRRLPWGAGEIEGAAPYEPGRLVIEAQASARRLGAGDDEGIVATLVELARVLLQLVEEARYPLWAEGFEQADRYRDEAEELVSIVNDEDDLARGTGAILAEVAALVDQLPALVEDLGDDFDTVARNGYRRPVSAGLVEAVEQVAGRAALLSALLAVELDPRVGE